MKTPLQILIEKLEERISKSSNVIEMMAIKLCVLEAKALLPLEEKMVADVRNDGYNEGWEDAKERFY